MSFWHVKSAGMSFVPGARQRETGIPGYEPACASGETGCAKLIRKDDAMQATFDHLEFRLGARDAFTLSQAATAAITVVCGSVWVTQDGLACDHVLKTGDTLRVAGDELVLLSALTPSQVNVMAPRRLPGVATRTLRWLMAIYLRRARSAALRASARRSRTLGAVY
jgi:hypothetical protein